MDREIVKKLNEFKKNHKKLNIEICNDFGEIGQITGYLDDKIKYNINYDFYFKAKCADRKYMTLDIALENYKVKNLNTFYALKIRDAETNEVIYKNSYQKAFLLSNLNNFNLSAKPIKQWKNDKVVKTLLKNIGQYVCVNAENFETLGILKAVYLSKKSNDTMIKLIRDDKVEQINLSKKNNVKILKVTESQKEIFDLER